MRTGLIVAVLALAVGCVPSAVRDAAGELGDAFPLYREGVAPVSTLTPAERIKLEILAEKIERNAATLRAAR